ncbi:MAG TPA: ATP-binding protein [Chitinophagaceae bacterium]
MKIPTPVHETNLEEMLNDCSIDAIIAIDHDNKIIAWNTIAEKIHGKSKYEVIGKDLLDIISSISEDEESVKAIQQAKNGIKSFVPASKNYYYRIHAENHFIPLKEGNRVVGVMNLVHDVAHRIKAEEQLQYLNDELSLINKELQRRNTELLSLSRVASHDLKEPLRRIYSAVEMIITTDAKQLSNSGKAHLRRIQSAAQRMGLITDDLLSFTSVAEMEKTFLPVDLNAVLEDAKKKLETIINQKNAKITSDQLPEITGNYELLVQLFKNIIHNALKFQKDKAPEVTIVLGKGILENEPCWLVKFIDNGIGFNQQHAEEIFNLFTKLNPDSDFRGSGMGLAVSQKIIERHSGYIQAYSEEGRGTQIWCYFRSH